MKKKLLLTSVLTLSLAIGVGAMCWPKSMKVVNAYDHKTKGELPTTLNLKDSTSTAIRNYYADLTQLTNDELTGENLLASLKPILSKDQIYYSYDEPTGTNNAIWHMYEIIDRDWKKSPASDIVDSTSDTYISGSSYDSETETLSGYKYRTTNPYLHVLYYDRDYPNHMTAWFNHGGTLRTTTELSVEREHIWPKSHGFSGDSETTGGARGDPMHLWAGEGVSNGVHSDDVYGYVDKSKSYKSCGNQEFTTYTHYSTSEYAHHNYSGTSLSLGNGRVFEPQDSDKGDIARAIFYMAARYNDIAGTDNNIDCNNPNLRLSDEVSTASGQSTKDTPFSIGILHDLLEWHKADPVDEFEIHRNNILFNNYTNNRNPFIDFPEWADFIWGTPEENMTYSAPTGYANPAMDTINGYNEDVPEGVVDVLNSGVTGITVNKYLEFTDKSVPTSDALYSGVCAGSYNSIQLRTTNSNEGVVQTKSGGTVNKITVDWNTNTATNRRIDIYGKNSAYSSATDLYSNDSDVKGALLGSIINGTNTSILVSGDYDYIGFRANGTGALYLDNVYIEYKVLPTSITATANRGFHPGEAITKNDITVVDNLGNQIDNFEFADNNHIFTYEEVPADGVEGTKLFEDTISYGKLKCDLSVTLSRRNYVAPLVDDVLTFEDIGTGKAGYTDFSNVTFDSPAVYAGTIAGAHSSIQLNTPSPRGIITTASGGKLLSVEVEWNENMSSSNTLRIYGKNTAYDSSADLYNESTRGTLLGNITYGTANSLSITGDYAYIGIVAAGGALYMDSITITYKGNETASNVSNYIMIDDTNDQCLTKLDLAIAKLNTMSTSEKALFWESETYVIKTARTRLNAWATHEKKTITYVNDSFILSSGNVSLNKVMDQKNINLMIIVFTSIGATFALAILLQLKKKKEQ